MKDELVRAMTKDGFVNAVAVATTGIVERARQIHKTLPTATAALGRLLTAASMMGNMQKVDDGSITLQLKGSGPLGRLLAVSDAEGNVRGWVENPQISMLEKASGKLDVAPLSTHVFEGWEHLPEALQLMKDKPAELIKPVVKISD